mmetsp:Transcript_5990/g.12676  ORF Transcript_5990/g.12676 Transcript_5990/m.12676 type:complete len:305 (+) Transcript_5990:1006-1920(+)
MAAGHALATRAASKREARVVWRHEALERDVIRFSARRSAGGRRHVVATPFVLLARVGLDVDRRFQRAQRGEFHRGQSAAVQSEQPRGVQRGDGRRARDGRRDSGGGERVAGGVERDCDGRGSVSLAVLGSVVEKRVECVAAAAADEAERGAACAESKYPPPVYQLGRVIARGVCCRLAAAAHGIKCIECSNLVSVAQDVDGVIDRQFQIGGRETAWSSAAAASAVRGDAGCCASRIKPRATCRAQAATTPTSRSAEAKTAGAAASAKAETAGSHKRRSAPRERGFDGFKHEPAVVERPLRVLSQ